MKPSTSSSSAPVALAIAGVVGLGLGLAACSATKGDHRPEPGSAGPRVGSAVAGGGDAVLPPPPELPAPAPGLPPLPAATPAVTSAQVVLGELLFFDGRLASDGTTSCATCHDPDADWSGTANPKTAAGKPNLRRAPSLTDIAWRVATLGWDGRYRDLEGMIIQHFRGQLGVDPSQAIGKIAALPLYRAHFQRAFGADPDGGRVLTALAAFVQTRYSEADAWTATEHGAAPVPGAATSPMTNGYLVFTGKAQCSQCHLPPLYVDGDFHRLGLIALPDDGRGKLDVTKAGAFKTQPLRGAVHRKAFFHDGSATTLAAAIDWHLLGGTGQGADRSIIDLPAVALTPAERTDLGTFVRALSADRPPYPRPLLPR